LGFGRCGFRGPLGPPGGRAVPWSRRRGSVVRVWMISPVVACELAPVSWTPEYARVRAGRSPTWDVRTNTPISSARTHWSWRGPRNVRSPRWPDPARPCTLRVEAVLLGVPTQSAATTRASDRRSKALVQ